MEEEEEEEEEELEEEQLEGGEGIKEGDTEDRKRRHHKRVLFYYPTRRGVLLSGGLFSVYQWVGDGKERREERCGCLRLLPPRRKANYGNEEWCGKMRFGYTIE